jgi:hypothetical protein
MTMYSAPQGHRYRIRSSLFIETDNIPNACFEKAHSASAAE